jgi:hypothetical protein
MPNFDTRGQCYKAFYRGNLLPFQGNTVILCYKAILPGKLLYNDSKLPWYFCNQCYKTYFNLKWQYNTVA